MELLCKLAFESSRLIFVTIEVYFCNDEQKANFSLACRVFEIRVLQLAIKDDFFASLRLSVLELLGGFFRMVLSGTLSITRVSQWK